MRKSQWSAVLLGMGLFPVCSHATQLFADAGDFTSLSLEELANLEISSVSRKAEPLSSAAASVFVITAEDIRRHGAATLPEALRLAPNLQVARFSASGWSISARGFNNTAANKLLVLIDGRPIYTPLHSGVYWDTHDVYMPDVERIEVISGPNATTWGSNAVNGVINVVTRDAGDSGGANVAVSAGEEERVYQARIGGAAGDMNYRVYGKHFDADARENAAGTSLEDDARRTQAGFRLDFSGAHDGIAVQGDVFDGEIATPGGTALEISGANLLAHWRRELGADSALNMTGYIDSTTRRNRDDGLESNIDTAGVSASHRFMPTEGHVVVWGTDIRHARDDVTNIAAAAFLPAERRLDWLSLFIQDEWRIGENLSLILGARAEDNDYTGVEFMPNIRLAWQPAEQHTLWTSASRAVRTPSRFDRDLFIPAEPPYLLAGGPDFDSEIADVIELGWRAQAAAVFSWSVTAFHHDYDRLRAFDVSDAGSLIIGNGMRGTISGVEAWWTWQPVARWRLDGGFALLDKELELQPGSTALVPGEGNDPDAQWQLRSSWDMTERTALQVFVRHADDLPDPEVPDYTTVDARFGWRLSDGFEIALEVNNLLDEEYAEFGAESARPEFGREAFVQLEWNIL